MFIVKFPVIVVVVYVAISLILVNKDEYIIFYSLFYVGCRVPVQCPSTVGCQKWQPSKPTLTADNVGSCDPRTLFFSQLKKLERSAGKNIGLFKIFRF